MPKILSGWIEIFSGGIQKDSQGREHDATTLIEKAVETFDPKFHEPPVVVGHPTDNSPAFGWVEGLKKSGNILLAKFKDVVPEFGDAVKTGLYKKRSASFYPDGRLRHVGFLGGTPPAVKGLADIGFKAGEYEITFEFEEDFRMSVVGRIMQRLREFIIEKFDTETADKVINNYEIEDLKNRPEIQEEPVFSEKTREDDNMPLTAEQLQEKLDKQAVDFAEKLSTVESKIKEAREEGRTEATTEFAEKERNARRDARKQEISTWCKSMVDKEKMTPGLIKFGIPEMLTSFADSDDVIEFSESKEKATLYDRFKALFETELPKLVNFGEHAGRDTDVHAGDAAGKLEALIIKKRAADKDLSYSAAFSEVQAENPDLATEYQQEMTG